MRRALIWIVLMLFTAVGLFTLAHQRAEAVADLERGIWADHAAEAAEAAHALDEALQQRTQGVQAAAAAVQAALIGAPAEETSARIDRALAEVAAQRRQEVGVYLMPAWRGRYARAFGPTDGGASLRWDRAATYTAPENSSWHEALVMGEGWTTVLDPEDGHLYAQVSVPLFDPSWAEGTAVVGIAFVRHPRAEVEAAVAGLGLTKTGYGFVVTRSGGLIGHPYVDASRGIYTTTTLAAQLHDPALRLVGQRALLGQRGEVSDRDLDPVSARRGNAIRRWSYQPIPSASWSLVTVIPESEAHQPDVTQLQHVANVQLGVILNFYLLVGAVAAIGVADPSRRRWIHAIALSLSLAAGIQRLWAVGMEMDDKLDEQNQLLDPSGVEHFLSGQEDLLYGQEGDRERKLLRIPAGVHLQSMEFDSANNITLTGVAWIRYYDAVAGQTRPGLYFPEAVEQEIEELYERPIIEQGVKVGTTLGYRFHLLVRERFTFDRYPFDTKDVWLRMLPVDFDGDAVLVPDLEAYPVINPSQLPGLESDIVLAGWDTLQSYFRYRQNSYSTNFGIREYVGRTGFPELYYTVDLRRDFGNAFVSDIIPLLVVACLLFGVLATATTQSDRVEALGFNFTGTLAAASGLVFVVLLSHIQLRSSLAGQRFTYLEWYYVVMYITILAVSLNAWMVARPQPPAVVARDDNELSRLLFWPLLMGFLFAVTFAYFYPRDAMN